MHGSLYTRSAAIALGMGILVSPDTIVLLGKVMGSTGRFGLGLLMGAMMLFTGLALTMDQQIKKKKEQAGYSKALCFLPLAVKVACAVFIPTGILVSSGFVFNEVFVYWFPNFGFAFGLLALITGIQFFGTQTALRAQIIFAGLTLTCFFILIVSGLGRAGAVASSHPSPDLGTISLVLMLWIGFDLAWAPGQRASKATAIAVIAGAGLLFTLWGLVSIIHVPLDTLHASSVPHMKTAGALPGETGRYIMGAAVIMGTLCAVNALFLACRYTARQLADQGLLPPWVQKAFPIPLILALGIGAMMTSGMAGSDTLELWIRAALLLWLLTYIRLDHSLMKLALTILLTAGVTTLIFSGDRPVLMIIYMATIIGAGLVPCILNLISTRKPNQRSLP